MQPRTHTLFHTRSPDIHHRGVPAPTRCGASAPLACKIVAPHHAESRDPFIEDAEPQLQHTAEPHRHPFTAEPWPPSIAEPRLHSIAGLIPDPQAPQVKLLLVEHRLLYSGASAFTTRGASSPIASGALATFTIGALAPSTPEHRPTSPTEPWLPTTVQGPLPAKHWTSSSTHTRHEQPRRPGSSNAEPRTLPFGRHEPTRMQVPASPPEEAATEIATLIAAATEK